MDYEDMPTEKLRELRDRIDRGLRLAPGGTRGLETAREVEEEELAEIEYELERRQEVPVVYTVACSGGCGQVFDLSDDPGVYVCRRCQMMSRS